MTSTFCCGKECVSRTWKGKRKLCVLYQVLAMPYIQSPRVLQLFIKLRKVKETELVGDSIRSGRQEGGERNFNVLCVRQEPFHLPALSYAIFLELQTWNLGGRSPLLCLEPDGFPAWEAPSY